MEIPLTDGFYVLDSLPASHQKCINWVPVNTKQAAISGRQAYGTPGLRLAATTGSTDAAINRGAWTLDGIPYFVNGGFLQRLDRSYVSGVETFTTTQIGAISGSGRVSMADNGTQLMILVPGGDGYIYTVAGGLVTITDADFTANGDPQYVVFIDGYFACSTDSKKWIVSSLNDGTAWDALDFGTAEQDPDIIVAPVVHNNQIFLTGGETTEGNQNIGGSGFPFQRNNVFLDKGCYAPFSLVPTNQSYYMIGGGKNELPAVWAFEGGAYVKKSTEAIDMVMDGYTDTELAAAFAMAWSAKGQYFVSFSFTDRTFTYNMTTKLWHEQKSSIDDSAGDPQQARWRVNSMVTAYGYLLAGDSQDGRIGIIDWDIYKEYGNNIVRKINPPPLHNKGKSFRCPSIELTMEAGVGNADVPDPVIAMAISEDAKTFDYERVRKIGPIGKYGQRTIWKKNGRIPRYAVLEFTLTDAVKPVLIKLDVAMS